MDLYLQKIVPVVMRKDSSRFTPSFDDTAVLMTASGEQIDPTDPDPAAVRLQDIAHGLAQQCRSAGQTVRFYSVGLHSLYVAEELERTGSSPRVQLYGLLHDAAEAYLGDVPKPVKNHLPGYETLESDLEHAIWKAFELTPPDESVQQDIKAVDRYLREYEFATVLPHFPENTDPPDLPYDLHADETTDIQRWFVDHARELCANVDVRAPE